MRNEGHWLNRQLNETESLLLRVHKKGHVLRFDGEDKRSMAYDTKGPDNKKKEIHTQTFTPRIKILRSKRAKENGLELSPSDHKQIQESVSQIAHVLRDDDDFRRELVRVYHRRINEVYPLGTGCDLTPSFDLIKRADNAAAAGKPFEFMVLLLAGTRKAYELCEEYRGSPLRLARSST